jgi:hypothetical protein
MPFEESPFEVGGANELGLPVVAGVTFDHVDIYIQIVSALSVQDDVADVSASVIVHELSQTSSV